MPTTWAQDVDGWNQIQVIKGNQSFMTEDEAQEECDAGCKPVEVILPKYVQQIIEQG
jgi:hypothetical protein